MGAPDPEPDRNEQHRRREARHPRGGDPHSEAIVQDESGGRQDCQLGHREDHIPGQLGATAQQADGRLIEDQRRSRQGHSHREQRGLPEAPADRPEMRTGAGRDHGEAEAQQGGAGGRGQQRGRDQPGPVAAPGQFPDEHRAQAQHADRAQQGHGRDRGRPVADRPLREQAGRQGPVHEAKHRRCAGGGHQAARTAQQVPVPPPGRLPGRPGHWRGARHRQLGRRLVRDGGQRKRHLRCVQAGHPGTLLSLPIPTSRYGRLEPGSRYR